VAAVALPLLAAGPAEPPRFPDMELMPLDGGPPVELADFRGRPVLITFWASWCGPCREELPELKRIYDRLAGRGFVFVAVNMDRDPRRARAFLRAHDLAIPAYRVSPAQLRELGVRSIPTSVLLRPDGRVEMLYQGYTPSAVRDIEQRVRRMLGAGRG